MVNRKKLYIVPGLGESTRCQNYREIIRFAREIGLQIIPVKIDWQSNKPMSYFIDQVNKQIPDTSSNDYILGFSFGAYITAVLAPKKRARGYIFCSLSPYFKEDIVNIPEKTKKYFGKILMDSFKKYSFPKNTAGQAWFLVGSEDWDLAISRAKLSYHQWKGKKKIFLIKDAGHQLSHPSFVSRIKEILKKLSSFPILYDRL